MMDDDIVKLYRTIMYETDGTTYSIYMIRDSAARSHEESFGMTMMDRGLPQLFFA